MGSTLLQQLERSYFLIGPVAFLPSCREASSFPVYLTDASSPSAVSLSTVDTATRVVSWAAFVYFDFVLFISWYQALNIVL